MMENGKLFKNLSATVLLSAVCVLTIGAAPNKEVMKVTKDGICIINTTHLCSKKGFRGVTPVEVYIKKGKVLKVVPLENEESPSFFVRIVNNLLPEYTGVKISQARKKVTDGVPDACSGATYSASAVQENIKIALEYYERHGTRPNLTK